MCSRVFCQNAGRRVFCWRAECSQCIRWKIFKLSLCLDDVDEKHQYPSSGNEARLFHDSYAIIQGVFKWKHFYYACAMPYSAPLIAFYQWWNQAERKLFLQPISYSAVDWEYYLTQASWVIGYSLYREFNTSRSRHISSIDFVDLAQSPTLKHSRSLSAAYTAQKRKRNQRFEVRTNSC